MLANADPNSASLRPRFGADKAIRGWTTTRARTFSSIHANQLALAPLAPHEHVEHDVPDETTRYATAIGKRGHDHTV